MVAFSDNGSAGAPPIASPMMLMRAVQTGLRLTAGTCERLSVVWTRLWSIIGLICAYKHNQCHCMKEFNL